jgi:hypothetical protein
MSQTTGYGFQQAAGFPGLKADLMFDQVDSYAAEGVVPFGRGVVQGTADNQCKLAVAAGTFLGVALHTHTVENDGSALGYADEDAVSVGVLSRAYVEAVGEVNKEADAYVVVAVGANQGKFTESSAGGNLGPVGRFKTSGEDELVVVEITAALRGATGPQGPAGV